MEDFEKMILDISACIQKTDNLYAKWDREHGNGSDSTVLYLLLAAGVHTQKEMIELYGMPKQSVNSAVAELKRNGYVIDEPNPADGRSRLLQLTEAGRQYAEQVVRPLQQCELRVLQRMGEQEVAEWLRVSRLFMDLLEEEMKKEGKK